ncbi:MAG: hypothetical protein U0935_02255 [Pirellulales bacterium]
MSAAQKARQISRQLQESRRQQPSPPPTQPSIPTDTHSSSDAPVGGDGAAHLQGQTSGGDWITIHDVW